MTIQVPYLTEEAIERDAEALLADFAACRAVTLRPPIPIEDVIEKHLKLRFEFDDLHKLFGVLQENPEPDILGAIWVNERIIRINQILDPDEHPEYEGRYRFTLAHEGGGHWRLHRPYITPHVAEQMARRSSPTPAVICMLSQARKRIEWQADFYAACLLMPRAMVFDAWRTKLGIDQPIAYEMVKHRREANAPYWNRLRSLNDILRRTLNVDSEADHDYMFNVFGRAFAPIFGVSAQAMRIRLERLGLLRHEISEAQRAAVA